MNNYGYPPYALPGGFDPDAFIKFMEYLKTSNQHKTTSMKSGKSEVKDFLRLWNAFKEADEKKLKEEAEKKKKDEEEKKKKEATVQQLPKVSFGTVILMMMAFGLPVGALWLTVLEVSMNIVKGILFK